MRDIRYLLTAWGNWSGSRIGTEYKAAWPLVTASSDIRPMLSDEDGETVDRAVGRLKYFDPLGYDIVVAYYKGKVSCRAIGEGMEPHRHHSVVSKVLERAEAYIAGRVAEILEAA
ncbi:antiterminator Q family protein [Symbiopectobacterium purcellii]|uniref:antiterminator Q family protein n=1 Tax=Symbiopectobacterium purcellii TaxID=2871826 RepID=UPI003F8266CB